MGLSTLIISAKQKKDSVHVEDDNDDDATHMDANSKLKKSISIKPSIQIKLELHHYLFYEMNFKTRPHLLIFARYFENIF
jgi:hypothetical protein